MPANNSVQYLFGIKNNDEPSEAKNFANAKFNTAASKKIMLSICFVAGKEAEPASASCNKKLIAMLNINATTTNKPLPLQIIMFIAPLVKMCKLYIKAA